MPGPNEKAIERRLGAGDSRGTQGRMARGNNVYRGGAPNAQQGGGPQFGRPPTNPGIGPGGVPGGGMPPGLMGNENANPMAPILEQMMAGQNTPPTPSGATMSPVANAIGQLVPGGPPPGIGGGPPVSGGMPPGLGVGSSPMGPPNLGGGMPPGGPPGLGMGGPPPVGGPGGNVPPEVMAAIMRKLGAGGMQ